MKKRRKKKERKKTHYVCVTVSGRVNLWLDAGRKQAQDPHYRFVGGVKFTQWEGSAVVIHCKKNGPACFTKMTQSLSLPLAG